MNSRGGDAGLSGAAGVIVSLLALSVSVHPSVDFAVDGGDEGMGTGPCVPPTMGSAGSAHARAPPANCVPAINSVATTETAVAK
jgi:hypothetical protein